MISHDQLQRLADELYDASQKRQVIKPLRDIPGLSETDGDSGYAIQLINTQRAIAKGRRVTGRKIGLTSVAVQQQLGVDQPDFGCLFDDMEFSEGIEIPMSRLIQPKAEAEVAIVLDRDLLSGSTGRQHSFADIVRATAFALPAIEIVDSRIADWNIKFLDTVADNASSGLYVLGGRPVPLHLVDVRAIPMEMTINGVVASTGSGAACLGHPLNAARWLANALSSRGVDLYAGDVIMTGALGPMKAISAGDVIVADFGPLGTVTTMMSKEGNANG
jgi:2-keto-4-pentenoate hydratase